MHFYNSHMHILTISTVWILQFFCCNIWWRWQSIKLFILIFLNFPVTSFPLGSCMRCWGKPSTPHSEHLSSPLIVREQVSHLHWTQTRLLGCPETSVRNYHYSWNNLEECSSHLLHGRCLKSSIYTSLRANLPFFTSLIGNVQCDVQMPNTVYWQQSIMAILMQPWFKFQSSAYHTGHLIWAVKG